jgi:hypothetical protein
MYVRRALTIRIIEVLAAIQLVCFISPCKASTFEWVRQFGTPRDEAAFSVATDGLGLVYVAGATGGDMEGQNFGDVDAFVSQFDSEGNLLWTRQHGTSARDFSTGVSADALGNVFIGGFTFGNLGGSASPGVDAFVSKYSSGGILQWTRQIGTQASDECSGIAADGFGNVYVTGYTEGDLDNPNAGNKDAFVSKYDGAGNRLWTRLVGTPADDSTHDISTDGLGSVYISGYTDSGIIGGNTAGSQVPGYDAFITRFDEDGTHIWTKQLGSTTEDNSLGVSADGAGNIYISGYTLGNLGAENSGSTDAFVSRYDETGSLIWTRQIGTDASDISQGVSSDRLGNVYISGRTSGSLGGPSATPAGEPPNFDCFVSKFDELGNLLWTTQFGTPDRDDSLGIAADRNGSIYLAGYTVGNLGGNNLGPSDVFVAKIFDVPESRGINAPFAILAVMFVNRSRSGDRRIDLCDITR